MELENNCKFCGKPIRSRYVSCYHCNNEEKLKKRYTPERIPWHDSQDLNHNRSYQAYILSTDYGHYVGHSGSLNRRILDHQDDKVLSTAGGNPQLIWKSEKFKSRYCASGYEAALKAWRDFEEERYKTDTGLIPIPFIQLNDRAPEPEELEYDVNSVLSTILGVVLVIIVIYTIFDILTG